MDKLRKEISDLSGLVKDRTEAIDLTLDASSQIARSMEALVAKQDAKNRFQQLNSFVAYLLFTLLLGGAFYVLYKSSAKNMLAAQEEALESAKEARARARELQDSQVARKRSALSAKEYYSLIHEQKYVEVIAGYPKIEVMALSETERSVFEDAVENAKVQMIDVGFKAGLTAFKRNDFEAAIAEFRRGLTYAGEGSRAAQMNYYLGISLSRQGSAVEAIKKLEQAISGRVDQAGIDDAEFHLANAMVQKGELNEARTVFGNFANAHPNHRFAQMARRKAAQILRAARERERMTRSAPKPLVPSL